MDTTTRYVAHVDMLGMSQLTLNNPDLAWSVLCKLDQAKEERLHMGIELTNTGEMINDRVTTFTFSDTIVAFSKADEPADTVAIVLLITELFYRALHYGIPLRCGIAHGRFVFNFDRNLFVGPALVRACQLGEEAQWLGVRVDEHVASAITDLPQGQSGKSALITEWCLPMRGGEIANAKVVDWVVAHRHDMMMPPKMDLEMFYRPFADLFGPLNALPPSVRAKYENTLRFINNRWAACS